MKKPWPRYRVALLLDKINMLSPSTIGLDMLFAEPDRTSLDVVQKELLRDLNIDVSFNTGAPLENNDQLLARSMADAPVVLGYNFFFHNARSSKPYFLHPIEVIIRHDESFSGPPPLFEARNVTTNLPEFSSAVQSSGFLNYPADDDGILRRVPLIMAYQGKFYPSLALAAAMRNLQVDKLFVEMEGTMIESLSLNEKRIPIDNRGNLLVRFQGRRNGFDYISAGDILNDAINEDRLKNKIVFVGTSAAGLQDTHPTPLDPHFSGVEVHATIVENILIPVNGKKAGALFGTCLKGISALVVYLTL